MENSDDHWSGWRESFKSFKRQASMPANFGSPSPRHPDEMIKLDGLSKKEIFDRYCLGMRDMSLGPLTPAQKECAQMMWSTRLRHKVTLAKQAEGAKQPQVVVEWDSYDE